MDLMLSGLLVFKALGPNHIGPVMLKELYNIKAPILEIIFNTPLKNHVVAQDWKLLNIIPMKF